jgi:hypothetical protein
MRFAESDKSPIAVRRDDYAELTPDWYTKNTSLIFLFRQVDA